MLQRVKMSLERSGSSSKSDATARAAWLKALSLLLFGACSVDARAPDVFDDSSLAGDGLGGASSTAPSQGGNAAEQGGSSSGQGGTRAANGGSSAQPGAGAGGSTATPGGGGTSPGAGGSAASNGGGTGQCSPLEPECSGSGVALSPLDGWVTRDTNGLRVHGAFYVSADGFDGGPSTVTPSTFAESGTDICVQGVAGPIGLNDEGQPDYAGDWGVLVGLNLSQIANGMRGPWSPSSTPEGTVRGFSFVLTGPIMPAALRFSAGTPDAMTSYCTTVTAAAGVTQSILFEDLVSECWAPGFGTPFSSSEPLGNLQWDIPALADEPVPFDFCVTELRGIVQ